MSLNRDGKSWHERKDFLGASLSGALNQRHFLKSLPLQHSESRCVKHFPGEIRTKPEILPWHLETPLKHKGKLSPWSILHIGAATGGDLMLQWVRKAQPAPMFPHQTRRIKLLLLPIPNHPLGLGYSRPVPRLLPAGGRYIQV